MLCIPDSWYWRIPCQRNLDSRQQSLAGLKILWTEFFQSPGSWTRHKQKCPGFRNPGKNVQQNTDLKEFGQLFLMKFLCCRKFYQNLIILMLFSLWERCLISFVIRGQSIYDVAMYTYSSRRSRKQATCLGQMLNLVLLAWCNKKKLILRARMNAKYPWSYSPHQIMHR